MRADVAKNDGEGAADSFVPPDFDEDAFIHSEMVAFRASLLLVGLGIVVALVSWALFHAMGGGDGAWFASLLLFVAVSLGVRSLLPRLKVDTSKYTKPRWFGTYFLLFVTWLAFFLLFVNPPVSDYAPPQVGVLFAPSAQMAGGDVAVELVYADNVAVRDHQFSMRDSGGRVVGSVQDLTRVDEYRYTYTAKGLPEGTYRVTASATDARGHLTNANATLTVGGAVLRFIAPPGGQLKEAGSSGDPHSFLAVAASLPPCPAGQRVSGPCLRAVVLRPVAGMGGEVTLQWNDAGTWRATSAFKGFNLGNNTFEVVAQQAAQHFGPVVVPPRDIVLKGPFTVNVTVPPGETVVGPMDPVVGRSAPGAGVGVAVVVLACAALVRRRKA